MPGSSTAPTQLSGHIPGIDGLRAIAVLAVVLFHAFPAQFSGGFVGVDVFFVISGFVVSASLYRYPIARLRTFLSTFYMRRIVRIYPPLVVCLLVVLFISRLFIPISGMSEINYKVAVAAFLGLGNVAQVVFNDSYFSPTVEYNPFIHTWSLGVEEQFYLVFPLMFFFWKYWDARAIRAINFAKLLFPALFVLSFALAIHYTTRAPNVAYYMLFTRFWELALGVLLLIALRKGMVPLSPPASLVAFPVGFALIAWSTLKAQSAGMPYPWGLPATLGAMLCIYAVTASAESGSFVAIITENAVAQYIGRISYSLYLWHWPVFTLMRWTIGFDTLPLYVIGLVITTLLASASYHFVEIPTRQWNSTFKNRRGTFLAASAAAIGACTLIGYGFQRYGSRISLSVTKNPKDWAGPDAREIDRYDSFKLDRGPVLYVTGDSHAACYYPMLKRFREETKAPVVLDSDFGNPIGVVMIPTMDRPDVQRRIKKMLDFVKPGDVVFLAAKRARRLCELWTRYDIDKILREDESEESRLDIRKGTEELHSLLNLLASRGIKVIIDAPKPMLAAPPFRCSDWFNATNPICRGGISVSKATLLKHRKHIMEAIEQLKRIHPNLIVWDPFSTLCPGEASQAFLNGRPVFFDGDHLNPYGCELLYPEFKEIAAPLFTKQQEFASPG